MSTATRDRLQADYQCVRDVEVPDSEVFRRASFVLDDGVRGLRQTYDGPSATGIAAPLLGAAERITAIDDLIAWEADDEQVGS